MDLGSIVQQLENAGCPRDVENVLNQVVLPEKNDTERIVEYKTKLFAVFEKITIANGLTNKQIRRRMERMMFVLHEGNIGGTKKVLPVIDRSSFIHKPSKHGFKDPKISLLQESFLSFIKLTENDNINANDIETALDKIGVFDDNTTIDENTKQKMLKTVQNLSNNETIVMNSKLRRRLKRIVPSIESLKVHSLSKRQKV